MQLLETHIKGNRFAKSAVETALLDGEAKRLGVPLSALLGGALGRLTLGDVSGGADITLGGVATGKTTVTLGGSDVARGIGLATTQLVHTNQRAAGRCARRNPGPNDCAGLSQRS